MHRVLIVAQILECGHCSTNLKSVDTMAQILVWTYPGSAICQLCDLEQVEEPLSVAHQNES